MRRGGCLICCVAFCLFVFCLFLFCFVFLFLFLLFVFFCFGFFFRFLLGFSFCEWREISNPFAIFVYLLVCLFGFFWGGGLLDFFFFSKRVVWFIFAFCFLVSVISECLNLFVCLFGGGNEAELRMSVFVYLIVLLLFCFLFVRLVVFAERGLRVF